MNVLRRRSGSLCNRVLYSEILFQMYKKYFVLIGRSVEPGGLWVVPINCQEQPIPQATVWRYKIPTIAGSNNLYFTVQAIENEIHASNIYGNVSTNTGEGNLK